MKRDARLHPLSSDHHHALVLARKAHRAAASAEASTIADAARAVREAFERELDPHFRIEEELLLPALEVAGEHEAVRRTLEDHASLRGGLEALGSAKGLADFASRLEAHVRFEERELFEIAQSKLSEDVLATIEARTLGRPR
jgi:hypothetical protein